MTKEQYVLLDDVNELIALYTNRELIADYVKPYELMTNQINEKIECIRENAEEF